MVPELARDDRGNALLERPFKDKCPNANRLLPGNAVVALHALHHFIGTVVQLGVDNLGETHQLVDTDTNRVHRSDEDSLRARCELRHFSMPALVRVLTGDAGDIDPKTPEGTFERIGSALQVRHHRDVATSALEGVFDQLNHMIDFG